MTLQNYTLLFEEQFDTLDLTNAAGNKGWNTTYHYGDRFLNSEQQIYVDPDYKGLGLNPFSVSDGILTITAEKAPSNIIPPRDTFTWTADKTYTSGLITSEGKFSIQYGYFEISAKMPAGQGLWPAFWLLQSNGEWPAEYDVVEVLGHDTDTLYASAHGKDAAGNHTLDSKALASFDSANGFHTYAMDWQVDKITWYYDGVKVYETTNKVFDQSMYVLANLAVGNWAGSPNDPSVFPTGMEIDYIRVYQKNVDHDVVGMPSAWQPIGTNAFSTLDESAAASLDWVKAIGSWDFSVTLDEKYTAGKMMNDWAHYLTGNSKDNYLEGYDARFNQLDGKGGNDVLKGNGGTDYFVIRNGDGNDTILDFSNVDGNTDKLKLEGFHFRHFDDVRPFLTETASGTVLRLDIDQAVFLKGVRISDLSPEQFIFVNSVAPPQGAEAQGKGLDFTGMAFTSYDSAQDMGGTLSLSSSGHEIQMAGNAWKKVAFNYDVTMNTVLEFQYKSTVEGELQGIGLETDNSYMTGFNTIQLYGKQANADFSTKYAYNGSGEWQTFKISASEYAKGHVSYLTFVNDHDDGAKNGNSFFRDIRIYEEAPAPPAPPSPPATGPAALDFTQKTFTAYDSNQDMGGTLALSADGREIQMAGNTWKKTALSYDVTDKTVIEFEYKSTIRGELQGLGLETDNNYMTGYSTIQLYGSQRNEDFSTKYAYNGSGEWQSFKISASEYAKGHISYLTFVNDHDDGAKNGNSFFRNIKIYEDLPQLPPPPPEPPAGKTADFTQGRFSSYDSGQDVDGKMAVSADGAELQLTGNTWKKMEFGYDVTENTVLEFQYKSAVRGELQGIGLETDSSYMTGFNTIKLQGTQSNDKFDGSHPYTAVGEWQTFRISAADYAKGHISYLTFVNDHDDGAKNSDSAFRNVRLYEEAGVPADHLMSVLDDSIYLPLSDEVDLGGLFTGTAAKEVFVYDIPLDTGGHHMQVENFGAEDALDISFILQDYDPLADALADFVSVETAGDHTRVYVDPDGHGAAHTSHLVADLHHASADPVDLDAMIARGSLVVG